MLQTRGVLETVLYADDLDAARRFYSGVLGLPPAGGGSELMVAFRTGPGSVLLVFDPAKSGAAGRDVPAHGSTGPGHVALLIDDGSYAPSLAALADAGVPVEQEIDWGNGVRSIYLRDPARNSVELITGDLWAVWEAEAGDG